MANQGKVNSLLENLVLARIDRDGPITAYGVRSLFADSPSDSLSSSTGSIYPILRRLEERGLIKRGPASDNRGTRLLTVTNSGSRQVRSWLLSGHGSNHLPEDPLRTKVLFLSRLSEAERRAWLQDAIEQSKSKLNTVEAFANTESLPADDYWAHENARRLLNARITWLDEYLAHEMRQGQSEPPKPNGRSPK